MVQNCSLFCIHSQTWWLRNFLVLLNWQLVMENGSLTPICSLSPSLTVLRYSCDLMAQSNFGLFCHLMWQCGLEKGHVAPRTEIKIFPIQNLIWDNDLMKFLTWKNISKKFDINITTFNIPFSKVKNSSELSNRPIKNQKFHHAKAKISWFQVYLKVSPHLIYRFPKSKTHPNLVIGLSKIKSSIM